MLRLLSCLVAAVGLLVPAPAGAQAPTAASPTASALPPTGSFGHALALHGETLFVGDPSSVHAPGRVVVYTLQNGSWTESTRLEASDAAVGDGFGGSLAVADDRLVVGAPAADAAYVFDREGDVWTQTARIAPPEELSGQFAAALALHDGTLFAGVTDPPFTFNPGLGAVHVFAQSDDGTWSASQTLAPDDLTKGDGFGRALTAAHGALFVGAPNASGRAGLVHVFAPDADGAFSRTQTLQGERGSFGAAFAATDDGLLIGAPSANGQRGAVHTVRMQDDAWTVDGLLVPFDAPENAGFGAAVASGANGAVWIGAPGVQNDTGALYGYTWDAESAAWTQSARYVHGGTGDGDRLGRAVAASEMHVAVSLPGDDYGAYMSGGSRVAPFHADAGWADALTPPSREIFSTITGRQTRCTDGTAELFDCKGVDLLSFLPIDQMGGSQGVRLNDVWGWTDPETDKNYALVGRVDGTAFVDVTDPMNPVFLGELPKTEGSEAKIWRDVKVYENHAFVVADNAGEHGMQVFDLTQLRDVDPSEAPVTFSQTAHYDGVHSAHNVFINEDTGFAYVVAASGGGRTCGGGLHMVDVRDPLQPTFAGCFTEEGTGMTGTGTTHDTQCVIYNGPDTDYQGQEVCFSSNETAISIADVTDKQNPVSIATASHPKSAYVHQGWLTEDQRYLYVNDELDEMSGLVDRTRTLVFDVADLDDPQLVKEFFLSNGASDHNLYVKGSLMYQANYKSGLRVVDVSDPANPTEIGHFDTLPFGADAPGFEGAFSVYPFFQNGTLIVTSMQEGLFVMKKSETEL